MWPALAVHSYLLVLVLMAWIQRIAVISLACLVPACALLPNHDAWHFITRSGHELLDGKQIFSFVGRSLPGQQGLNNAKKENCKNAPHSKAPYFQRHSIIELENQLKEFARTGITVVRLHALTIAAQHDSKCQREAHIDPPGFSGGVPQLNEPAMGYYDQMIALAEKYRLRLILPFINHWHDLGGRQQLSAFYGDDADTLYDIQSKTFAAYLHVVKQVILRRNTLTGRLYRDEPSVMAWEMGHELDGSTKLFVQRTAAFIKLLDSNHLVVDGTRSKINEFSLIDPNIDIVARHYYPQSYDAVSAQIVNDLAKISGNKAYTIGIWGKWESAKLERFERAIERAEYDGARVAGVTRIDVDKLTTVEH